MIYSARFTPISKTDKILFTKAKGYSFLRLNFSSQCWCMPCSVDCPVKHATFVDLVSKYVHSGLQKSTNTVETLCTKQAFMDFSKEQRHPAPSTIVPTTAFTSKVRLNPSQMGVGTLYQFGSRHIDGITILDCWIVLGISGKGVQQVRINCIIHNCRGTVTCKYSVSPDGERTDFSYCGYMVYQSSNLKWTL